MQYFSATGFIDNAQSSSVDPRIYLVGGSSLPGKFYSVVGFNWVIVNMVLSNCNISFFICPIFVWLSYRWFGSAKL